LRENEENFKKRLQAFPWDSFEMKMARTVTQKQIKNNKVT
jgi:hypothetical protein